MNYQEVMHLDAQQFIPTMNFFVFTLTRMSMEGVRLHTLNSFVLWWWF